jgi:hypothetical protein
MTAGVALVTASDPAYFSLLRGLVRSVRAAAASAAADALSLCVIDLGLSDGERAWVEEHADHVADGRWDIEIPGGERSPRSLQGITCRPFLPRYFPGHEVYVWIDADAWVQEWTAVELLIRAAADGSIGVVPQLDRAYRVHYDQGRDRLWIYRRYLEAFGELAADVLSRHPMLNAGVFSMRAGSAGWAAWADLLGRGLRRTSLAVDQTALNLMVYAGDVPAHFLPSSVNWMCLFASPVLENASGTLVHPMQPHDTLGIIHLVGPEPKAGPLTIDTTDGGSTSRWLTYRGEPR